jgi:hypothetical protein
MSRREAGEQKHHILVAKEKKRCRACGLLPMMALA